jgi:hypothetical protein
MKKLLTAVLLLATVSAPVLADIAPPSPPQKPDPVKPGPKPVPAPTPVPIKPVVAPATKVCYQLEAKAKDMTKDPQLLCIEPSGNDYKLRLTTGIPTSAIEVAVFTLQLKSSARCIDCNQDTYGIANPSNSVFNKLAVAFKGKRDVEAGTESGTVKIGDTKFFYHSLAK